ncbi:hypothetical protein [Halohasta litorea]|uniref:SPW repeat-containing protein n=1 Tax=Halohasta litorea TaxID=869891 RepID=A0ABD6D9F3_9EURY|nr:hypothetical protein [Halohasta litorea]
MAPRDFEPYFPNRPPTWVEVIGSVATTGLLLPNLVAEVDSFMIAAAGFILFLLALPFEVVEDCFHRIGMSGRGLLVLGVFIGVQLIAELAPQLTPILIDASTGGLLATLLYFTAFLAKERTVSGWRVTPDE